MRIRKLFNYFVAAVKDPERDFTERMYLILTVVSEIAVFIAFVGDLLTDESMVEILTLAGTLIVMPVITIICLRRNRVDVAIKLVVALLIFFILPVIFIFGGGLRGGGFIWVIFAYMYAGMVLSGKLRTASLIAITILTGICFEIAYRLRDLIYVHTIRMTHIDMFISVILVGLVCFLMSLIQGMVFKAENERARKEAERAEELTVSQNRFFSSMSHEIRTPINSILGLNELILRDENASDEIVKDASGIQGAGKMLLALINDILDFSKMEAGSMDIVPVDYRIGNMLSEIVNMIWLRAHEKGLKFDVSIDPKVPSVLFGDEVRIKQVIINLLNNAVKYTPSGSIGLHIESEEAGDDAVLLHISVSDTGMGIKKEAIPFLFDAFKRVDQEKNRMIEGTGLGLSIVKQIIELMGGNITVSSVYGEGSTFTAVIRQGVSDHSEIGELNIHNQQVVRTSTYESSFTAPEAAILIVDDNEMNLEVESRLLIDTEMVIDKAAGGKEALDMSLKRHYDVILMDHLMPEMDGIECMEMLRKQVGGLNRNTPVVVLTANAGSENRELYNRAGFDGYLVKPVSGESLEEMLIRHIAPEKLMLSSKSMSMFEDIEAGAGYIGKEQIMITTTCMADIPDRIIKKANISILPFLVKTDEGVFKDGIQMDSDEVMRYMKRGGNATSSAPTESDYTEFFANNLKRAHFLIHIAITTSMSDDYHVASEAARSFDNVYVVNSECLSSSTGILVMIANKLVRQGFTVEEIIAELESVKKRLKCSFIIDTTDYMVKKNLVSTKVHMLTRLLNLHPMLRIRDDRSGVGGAWIGSTRRAYRGYIRKAFPSDVIPDSEIVFITYVDVPTETLQWIQEEISRIAYFERVIFKQASAAIASNCGPGTFGILYFVKSNRSYNLGSYFEEENDYAGSTYTEFDETDLDQTQIADEPDNDQYEEASASGDELAWYQKIESIDGDAAIQISGSEDAYRSILKMFYDSIHDKYNEIQGYYDGGDWENYAIKVHALKSSARLIGATALADEAQLLENAGKAVDLDYINEKHSGFMQEYLKYEDILRGVLTEDDEKGEGDTIETQGRPKADDFLIETVVEGTREAAESEDRESIEEILGEIGEYEFPDDISHKLDVIREKLQSDDFAGILEVLNE
ncbi:MAG: DegV family EDD domain-containing protein [Lachnospiraceae bacterium]|nr:DegV family EDD domain-containing protein [Lachnospiraceae bacterium]